MGRRELPPPPGTAEGDSSAPLGLSAGDYDVNDAPIRTRWPVVDFGSGPGRTDLGSAAAIGGVALDLEPSAAHDRLLPRAPGAPDFGRATGRERRDGEAASEGHVLDLDPQPDVVRPSHPTSVAMRPDPNQPRRRQRRWPVVDASERVHDEAALTDIERAIATAAQSP